MDSDYPYRVSAKTVDYFANDRDMANYYPTMDTHNDRPVVLLGRSTFKMDQGPIWFAIKTVYKSQTHAAREWGSSQDFYLILNVI